MIRLRHALAAFPLTLVLHALFQVPKEDAAFDLASNLRAAWTRDAEWVQSDGQDASLAELEAHLTAVEGGVAAMLKARETRRQQTKAKLKSTLEDLQMSLKVHTHLIGYYVMFSDSYLFCI